MKQNVTNLLILFVASSLLWVGCSKETVDPNFTGSIEGQVQNSATGQGIQAVSITTNPGTDAILTGPDGQFAISDVPTGNYSIQATKEDFETKTVRVNVKEDRIASAQILLSTDEQSSSNDIRASVTSFANFSRNDSSFVEVDFRVENTGSGPAISRYEVYFEVFTTANSFFQEFRGDTLDSGEQTIGAFTKYIRDQNADSVNISGIFTPNI